MFTLLAAMAASTRGQARELVLVPRIKAARCWNKYEPHQGQREKARRLKRRVADCPKKAGLA